MNDQISFSSQPLTQRGPGFFVNTWHAIGLLFWWILIRGLNRVRITHPENRPRRGDKNVLICSNHVSALDPFVIAATSMPYYSPVWWRAPAKEELFRIPVLRGLLRTWGAFPVRRGKGDVASIESMARMIQSSVIVIFPEGTRSAPGEIKTGRSGVGKLIFDAPTAKVIPVRITGSERLLPKRRILPSIFNSLEVIYGNPLILDDLLDNESSLELSKEIVFRLMKAIRDLR